LQNLTIYENSIQRTDRKTKDTDKQTRSWTRIKSNVRST